VFGIHQPKTTDHERLLHLHGEKGARLDSDQSIHPKRSRTCIIKILSPLLFFGPEIHIRKLVKISVDSLVRTHDWDKLLAELTDDWKEFTLYVSVINIPFVFFLELGPGNGVVECEYCFSGNSKR
jgi:hypothetical protein